MNFFKFKHLKEVNMNYTTHFKSCMNYSWKSLQSSYYFFIHGIYPDVYEYNGSINTENLSALIRCNNIISKLKVRNSKNK